MKTTPVPFDRSPNPSTGTFEPVPLGSAQRAAFTSHPPASDQNAYVGSIVGPDGRSTGAGLRRDAIIKTELEPADTSAWYGTRLVVNNAPRDIVWGTSPAEVGIKRPALTGMIQWRDLGTARVKIVEYDAFGDDTLHDLSTVPAAAMGIPAQVEVLHQDDWVPFRITTGTIGRQHDQILSGPHGSSNDSNDVGYVIAVPRTGVGRQSPPTLVTLPPFVLPPPTLSGAGNLTVTLTGAVETVGAGPNQNDSVELRAGAAIRLEARVVAIPHPAEAWPGLLIPYSVTVTLSVDGNGHVRGILNSSGEARPRLYQYLIESNRTTSSATVQGGAPLLADGFNTSRILTPADSRLSEPETITFEQLARRELLVSISDPFTLFSHEQLARIQDALSVFNVALEFAGLRLTWVDSQSDRPADISIRVDTTSPCGDAEAGVLGCTIQSGQITILDGWNWYVGADPQSIANDQYDFQTVVTHELGHAVGLDHSHNADSAMFGTLRLGLTRRSLGVVTGGAAESAAHERTDQGGVCPVCGGSHGVHETENAPAFLNNPDQTQRVLVAKVSAVRFEVDSINPWPAGQFVETVVIPLQFRPVTERFTLQAGPNDDVLTGGNGVDLQFGDLGRDVLLGGFAPTVADAAVSGIALPTVNVCVAVTDAVLGELLNDHLDVHGVAK